MEQKARIRVLRVITRLNVGGPAIHVGLLTDQLDPERFETRLVVGQTGPSEGDLSSTVCPDKTQVTRVRSLQRALHPLKDLTALWQLICIIRQWRPHILHTHMAKAGALGRLAGLCYNTVQRLRGRAHRVVLVHTFHGHVLSGYFGWFATRVFLSFERWLARHTDALVAVSPLVRDDLFRLGIGDRSRTHVLLLGLDLSAFLSVDGYRQAFRRELGIPATAPVVGIVGRLVPIKQHELFLHAAALLARDDQSLRFVIVGDGERRAHLEALTRTLGLDGRVFFVGWRQDLPAIYADLDCVCLTSRNEGTPLSLIEALASARPVVATAVGGVPDLLGEVIERREGYAVAKRGLLVQLSDQADGLAVAVKRVLTDVPLRERLVVEGRVFAQEWLTAERLVRDLAALYALLVGSAQGGGLTQVTEASACSEQLIGEVKVS